MSEDILIWWLDQKETEKVNKNNENGRLLPNYIEKEVRNRTGRAGRGRLWVPKEIDCEEINWNDTSPVCKLISLSCAAGIVFYKCDFNKIKHLPGFVTDINCNWIDKWK